MSPRQRVLARCLLMIALVPMRAGAEATPGANPQETFDQAAQALERGSFEEAIDLLEGLSDRGYVHPDASFNRAVAYSERARTPQVRPGDLGRAAAALNEVLVLRPSDREAEIALERVRAEIGRRRVREGHSPLIARPSLPRAIVGLASESVWLVLAALGSLLTTLGLALRSWVKSSTVRLAGGISVAMGTLLLAVGGGLGALSGYYRRNSWPAVIVAREARYVGEDGLPLPSRSGPDSSSIPEGASVYVLERRGGLSRVEWGTREGWVPSHDLRVLGRL